MKKSLISFLVGFSVIFLMALTGDQIIQKVYDSANTALRVNVVAGGGGGGGITSGTTTIASGTDTAICYDAAGVIKCDATSPLWDPATENLALGSTPALNITNTAGYVSFTFGSAFMLDFELTASKGYMDFYGPTGAGSMDIGIVGTAGGGGTIWETAETNNIESNKPLYVGTSTVDPVHLALNSVVGASLVSGGHFQSAGISPAVTNTSANSCGTDAATLVGTDQVGKVTVGATSGTSCTVTFAYAWTNAPACIAADETTAVLTKAISTTTTVIISGAFTAADKLAYICQGYD